MNGGPGGLLNPRLEVREGPYGRGVFARQSVAAGEVLAVFGGVMMEGPRLRQLPPDARRYALQIEEDLYLVSLVPSPPDFINHCCEPNAALSGQVVLVSRRMIRVGEEIAYDYATSDSSAYDEFVCHCGASGCRGRVTGDDWQRPDLQQRYHGEFSPYLARKISGIQAATGSG